MDESTKKYIEMAEQRFEAVVREFRGEITLIVTPNHLVEICTVLRDEHTFAMLENETAVDYWPQQQPRFHVVYQLYSFELNQTLNLRVPLNGNSAAITTLESVYPNANWLEREIWDMFGIQFEGHSDLRRILMPQDWQGYPQRKDYPLGYEEVQFTFNFDQSSSYTFFYMSG